MIQWTVVSYQPPISSIREEGTMSDKEGGHASSSDPNAKHTVGAQ